jgi:hypothetical protein
LHRLFSQFGIQQLEFSQFPLHDQELRDKLILRLFR